MAFIVKGQQKVKNEEPVKPAPTPKPIPKKRKNPFQKEKNNDINNDYIFDKNKTYLVVGGKVKEISTKSKYILDMLIIEKEN